jgi:tetratricopeptide (TPR) repeat protein
LSAPKQAPRRKIVMISSTWQDLPDHREEIRTGCERAGFEPRGMEHLPAMDADAIAPSLQMVEEADVYVGIFAHRYGTVPEGYDISITEMEYNRAVELKKPRLIFFMHEAHPVTIKDIEFGPGEAKLRKLKERIKKDRVPHPFRSPSNLRAEVVEALTVLAKEFDAAEAGGATAAIAAKLHRRTAIPAPPEPYIAHPYTLLQSRELVGRQAELNTLTEWVADPASPAFAARVFCFVAIGGMGKSALTWKWFNQIAPNEMTPLAGRLWWSFYESDADFEGFMTRALCYVSGETEDEVRAMPWREREARLLRHLNEKPYLFVLDGLERILIAYHRMDASYLADDEYDEQTANWVAGAAGLPASAAKSFVGQHRLRQTTDLRAGAFLQKLAGLQKSRILITSRLYPTPLQTWTGHPRPGCFASFLPGLSDDDAIDLWRALNVAGSRVELAPIFRSVEGHPLLVQALASEVANYRKAPSDFAQWWADHPQFDPTSLPLVQSRTHILQFALQGLSEKVRKVLHTLVGFRMPASYAALEALLVGRGKARGSAQDLDRALTELEDRGLIGWDRAANRYDAHPIVRGVVWQLTDSIHQHAVYRALESHFEPMAIPDWEEVETIADLTPAIEHYHTLVGLERYDDACELFHKRLDRATLYRLAAHRERITWLERLFPLGVTELPALSSDDHCSLALSALAQSYLFFGQPGRAVPQFRRTIVLDDQKGYEHNLQIVFTNTSGALIEVGALFEAECSLRRALTLNRSYRNLHQEGCTLRYLGRVLSLKRSSSRGCVALNRSECIFTSGSDRQAIGVVTAYLAESWIRLGSFAYAERAWQLAAHLRHERDLVRAALTQGQVALALSDPAHADERLHHALTRARTVNMVDLELPSLIAIAQLELARNHPVEARSRLDDVWEAAERGPYPLYQADAYNVLADIARAEEDTPAAVDAATKAYCAAWCDGPPYAYHWGLMKANAHLAALGAPKPDMPPFDVSKLELMPEVEINPKDEYWVDPDKLE